jgi:hypothetical protein
MIVSDFFAGLGSLLIAAGAAVWLDSINRRQEG